MTAKRGSQQDTEQILVQADQELADQAILRTTGAERIPGNRVTLLRDAAENYPAWIRAIESATRWVHFEMYIVHDDVVGQEFAELLSAKARQGVAVRLIYDWLGAVGNSPRRFWRRLAGSGVDVRCFNPPRLDSPLSWVSRDHRKVVAVDGRIAFVTGLCVGKMWAGDAKRRIEPWRDTGIEIQGAAVEAIEAAFADAWAATGTPLDLTELPTAVPAAGEVPVRVIASVPGTGRVYRLDQLIAALSHRSIWLSDAYFAGTSSYVHALRSAAQTGVDVRLLIPGTNDVPIARAVARAGLRPLLEAGVRVFEWNGSMMHAKTSVVDGRWARVGSTNLNLTSWLGNWEMDVVVEGEEFAQAMEAMYLDDLSHSTEIVLTKRRRRQPAPQPRTKARGRRSGGASRAAAGVMRIGGNTVGAAITRRRELGPAEAVIMIWGAALLVVTGAVAIQWPKVIAFPAATLFIWLGASLLLRAIRLMRKKQERRRRQEAK